jgi:hypothetical protein
MTTSLSVMSSSLQGNVGKQTVDILSEVSTSLINLMTAMSLVIRALSYSGCITIPAKPFLLFASVSIKKL